MRALTWHGRRDVRIEKVADPTIVDDGDAIIEVTSTAICGSDLHLYEVLGPFLRAGDILGHEAMGTVVETGRGVRKLRRGDRVVVPFTIACGDCFFCRTGLQSQCETTQVREHGTGASLFGYTELYGSVPGGQAEFVRVPYADHGPITVGSALPDDRYLFLSDILPTAWQAVAYADPPRGGSITVVGLGPVGQFCVRIATLHGYTVHGVDPVPERRDLAARYGALVHEPGPDLANEIQEATEGRGTDAAIDAVGMEASGSPAKVAQRVAAALPAAVAKPAFLRLGVDSAAGLRTALAAVRRGGTVSIVGVYGGEVDPLPLREMFDRQLQLRMGQCNVRRWITDLLPLVEREDDPLGTADLVSHHLPLADGPRGYELFQRKEDSCVKVVLRPQSGG